MKFKSYSFFISCLLLFTLGAHAQTGLNFQGVARNTNNVILASQPISLRLSIIRTSVNGITEYSETRKVTTNAQGLFAVVIGDSGAISSLGNFSNIDWKLGPKFLKIEMDVSAGNNFILLGTTQFQSVAYAQFANTVEAEKITGIVPVEKGGTGVNSLASLKAALSIDKNTIGLSNVNNTPDTAKPISNATKVALDRKADTADLVLKAPLASPTFTGTVGGITKTMVGLSAVDNTSDLAKPISTATQTALDTKVSTETFSTTIATKENATNKSTATDLGGNTTSDILFPTQKAVKTYVDAQANSGGVADGGITNSKLAEAAVTNDKIASGIDKSKVGLGNVDNTADSLKPISIPVQAALDSKASSSELRSFVKIDTVNRFISEQLFDAGLTTASLTLGGGTRIESGINSETTLFNRSGADFIINTTAISGNDTPTSSSWIFKSDGTLSFDNLVSFKFDSIVEEFKLSSDKDIVIESYNEYLRLFANEDIELTADEDIELTADYDIELTADYDIELTAYENVLIKTGTIQDEGEILPKNIWRFDDEGNLKFPTNGRMKFYGPNQTTGSIYVTNFIEEEDFEYLSINHNDYVIIGDPNSENNKRFTFDMEFGSLKFYDGSRFSYTDGDMFSIRGNNGLILSGGNEVNTKKAEIHLTTSTNDEIENEDETQGDIYLKTKFYPDDIDEQIVNTWKFGNDGILTFPDGSTLAGNYSGSTYFELNTYESNGVKITTNSGPNPITWSFNSTGIMIFPDNTQIGPNFLGSNNFGIGIENKAFEIVTANEALLLENHWIFDKSGVLTLPTLENAPSPGTLQVGAFAVAKPTSWDPLNKRGTEAYPVFYNGNNWVEFGTGVGSGNSTPTSIVYVDPDLPTNFNIFTADEFGAKLQFYQEGVGIEKEWSYNTDGSLTFPDGTIISGSISGTANFGFDTRATDNGFTLITAGTLSGTSQLWSYNTDGSLTFPDGTIISGSISGTANFGFDTRASESIFSIITGTSSSTTQWTFGTDGVLNLPGSAAIGMIYDDRLEEDVLEIKSPQSFSFVLSDNDDDDLIWRFKKNGDTFFPGPLVINGDISQVNKINVQDSYAIRNVNIFDKFVTNNITLDVSQLANYNANTSFIFTLTSTPRSSRKEDVAMFLNGLRVNPDRYDLNGSLLTYRKSKNESSVEVQFDYIKL